MIINIRWPRGAGVTGRPIRPPQLEPNPLRSHQLSNTKSPPEAPLLIPQIHWLLLEGREKRRILRFPSTLRLLACFQQARNVNSGGF